MSTYNLATVSLLATVESFLDRDVAGRHPPIRGFDGYPWFRVSGDVVLAGHAASRAVA